MAKGKLDAYRAKAASVNTIKKSTDEAEKSNSLKNNNSGGFKKPHKVDMGENIFRVAPHHEPGETPYVAVYQSFLDVEKDEYENGEKTGKKIRGKAPVFLAPIHGPRDANGNPLIEKDIIELYISKVLDYVDESVQDDKEKKRILGLINGYNDRSGKFIGGIKPAMKYCCYAWDKSDELSELHLSSKQLDDMNSESMKENADETIAIDIFSKIEDGFPLVLDKSSKELKGGGSRIQYSVSALGPDSKTRETWEQFFEKWNLTEAKIEELLSEKSLDEKFVEVYTMRDFDRAMDGLFYVDEKIGAGLLNDDLLNQFEKIAELLPDTPNTEPDSDEKAKTGGEPSRNSSRDDSPEESSENITPLKMKAAIQKYSDENYEGRKIPKLSKLEVKDWYQLVVEGDELPFEEEIPEGNVSENESATQATGEEIPEDSVSSRVNSIRNRRKGK